MWTKVFWQAMAERAIKTFAQALAAFMSLAGVSDVVDVNWQNALGVAGFATLYSFLTSLGSGAITKDSPSLGPETLPPA